ncbi:YdcF family protein [Ancylobacter sp. SL191]|uniref:YdcF family protein n=1 Tax=Ancylobacter sp. SL191 TaxID=2995166 RepID=UPI002271BD12|nr:YdcF family protein [Ancylobacter sp. SL191]WAC26706.1 YdcF family protein [Ancylobacter sp. SL191]
MFFTLSKLVWMAVVPSTLLTLTALIGLTVHLTAPRWRLGRVLMAVGIVGLLLAGLGPFGRMMTQALEDRFPAFVDDGQPIAGIIVLGGAELPDITAARGQPAFQEAAERLFALADLSRRYPDARLVFSGGSGRLDPPPIAEADVIRQVLPQIGVDPGRVIFEGRSRNTAENARLTRGLVNPVAGERWLLVTSAMHMPRAMGCFRAAGFPVTAYPVDYRTTGQGAVWRLFGSVAEGLQFVDGALREWVGLVVYYVTGRTGALFPAP